MLRGHPGQGGRNPVRREHPQPLPGPHKPVQLGHARLIFRQILVIEGLTRFVLPQPFLILGPALAQLPAARPQLGSRVIQLLLGVLQLLFAVLILLQAVLVFLQALVIVGLGVLQLFPVLLVLSLPVLELLQAVVVLVQALLVVQDPLVIVGLALLVIGQALLKVGLPVLELGESVRQFLLPVGDVPLGLGGLPGQGVLSVLVFLPAVVQLLPGVGELVLSVGQLLIGLSLGVVILLLGIVEGVGGLLHHLVIAVVGPLVPQGLQLVQKAVHQVLIVLAVAHELPGALGPQIGLGVDVHVKGPPGQEGHGGEPPGADGGGPPVPGHI